MHLLTIYTSSLVKGLLLFKSVGRDEFVGVGLCLLHPVSTSCKCNKARMSYDRASNKIIVYEYRGCIFFAEERCGGEDGGGIVLEKAPSAPLSPPQTAAGWSHSPPWHLSGSHLPAAIPYPTTAFHIQFTFITDTDLS